jgi:hypothetical protein
LDIKDKSNDEKLTILDEYIRTHFEPYAEGETINTKIKITEGNSKLASRDFIFLYKYAFDILKIPYEIIATEDRFIGDLDDEIVTFYEFTDINFYFRDLNKFISPNVVYLAYGKPSYEYQDTKAKGYNVQKKQESYVYPLVVSSDFTKITTESVVTLNPDLSKVTIDKKNVKYRLYRSNAALFV